ncbi:MAG: glycerol-3-phosphate dehydrogenase/oxidase, partial [Thermoanaerobaculia bacterium]
SWRSTKLVHGGLRYLETGSVRLVFESLAERALLMAAAPHLVAPADFLLPAFSGRGRPRWQMAAGLTAYDLLSLGRTPSFHRGLSRKDVVRRERLLESPELLSGALYCDGRTDDARLTLENVLDAALLGAVAATGVEVEGLSRGKGGLLKAVVARDRGNGRALTVHARAVVNAAGPWGDRVRRMEESGAPDLLRLSSGVHVTVPRERLSLREIVAFPLSDGRLLFGVPHGAVTMLGTTDTDFAGSPDEVFASRGDVAYLLDAARQTFPAAALSERDVVASFAGLRPLVRQPGRSLEDTSREEAITVSEGGLVTVTGGKLTTHRRMGEEAIDRVARLLERLGVAAGLSATRGRPFPGARGRVRDPGTSSHLSDRYGSRATHVVGLTVENPSLDRPLVDGLPDIEAEIVFAAGAEDARSLSDALVRRTHLFWQAPRQGLECAERAAALMAPEVGWSRDQQRAALDAYAREVALSRRWQSGPPAPARLQGI